MEKGQKSNSIEKANIMIQKNSPDVIFLDIMFDGEPLGLELLEAYDTIPEKNKIPRFIIYTAHPDNPNFLKKALEHTSIVTGLLEKPVQKSELKRLMQKVYSEIIDRNQRGASNKRQILTQIEEIEELVIEDKIDLALKNFKEIGIHKHRDEIIRISSNWNALKSEINRNTIDFEQKSIEKSKIRNSIFAVLEQMKNDLM